MWAEVIGDPVAHSKSPAIHGFWLDCLGIQGSYKATLISEGKLGAYFEQRLRDPDWRGCNVTIPHKLAVIPFLDEASEIGAVNCVTREDGRLIGRNTDVDGFAEAIAGADLEKVVVIGAGGAARAALAGLREAGQIINITRQNIEDTTLLEGATLIVNATPLGMAHAGPMPRTLLEALPGGATALDMAFLQAARVRGLRAVDGLTMLIGQARQAFRLFFGAVAPRDRDDELRARIIGG